MSGVYLTRIRLEQYRSFKQLDISLRDGPGVLVVHGSNGIGKSSLFDGLEWALTDKIDHFRGADGVKKVGSYLCRWRDGAPGPTSVTMDFSGEKRISRTLSSSDATKSVTGGNIENITEFLKDDSWTRGISGLSSYLLLTHFLGQSTISRLTNRDPSERFDILKEAAESKEIEDVANALHGKGSTKAARAYNGRIKMLNDEVNALQGLLDTEANLWSGLIDVGALDEDAATELGRAISRLLDAGGGGGSQTPLAAFDRNTIGILDERLTEQRTRLRSLEKGLGEAASALAEWENASRLSLEHEAAKATADGQVKSLSSQHEETAASLITASTNETRAANSEKSIRDTLTLLTGLRDAYIAEASAQSRKDAADVAVAAAQEIIGRESAAVAALERRLQIVRRIEDEVGRLDERGQLAQVERRNVILWLTRDARVAELKSSIQALQLRLPTLDADIEAAEASARGTKALLDEQNVILDELRKTVSAMSSAVASVAANLPHDACDCPVCATHFELEGELQRRASSAAARLAPLVLAQEERVLSASQRAEAASNQLEQLRSAKRDLTSLIQECQSEEQARTELAVGVFGDNDVDRVKAEARQVQLASRAEKIARLRQRKWHWRNRLTGDFFAPGGEHATAVRRRDQVQIQVNAALQAQTTIATELQAAKSSVRELEEVVGNLRGQELAELIGGTESDLLSAEESRRRATQARQAIEQQLASFDVALSAARTRQQQAVEQIAAAEGRKTEAAAAWRKLAFAQSEEPDPLSIKVWTMTVKGMQEKLREADDLLKQLRDGRAAKALVDNHLTALERLRTAVNGAPNSERLQLRKEAEDRLAAKSRLAQATRETKEIAQAASSDILDELSEFNTSYMQPLDTLMKAINRAILCDPRVGIELHVKNRRVEQSAMKEGQVPAEIGSIDPVLVHSEGQMAALSVSMLCAASLTYPWSRWRGLILDDPLQHNDAIHSAAFADFVCNLVASRGYQVLLSTHDRAQAEFLRRKVASRNLPCAVLSLLGTGQDGVEWTYRSAETVTRVATSA
ncbi:AAA family ATPase [Sinorhizobium meliloti]|uniref:AAA family ATPase n=1 Tax=Rhizobium meliloti TaxID=382 RepID=UPI001297FB6B|nr:AAA family ATPase [Sinorhizobium meliloti]MDW9689293.1 AAA family ATPase [Sinorhizobium meliloti]MQV12924.1 AAA family ATPase [Sinorhizobium meliloti]